MRDRRIRLRVPTALAGAVLLLAGAFVSAFAAPKIVRPAPAAATPAPPVPATRPAAKAPVAKAAAAAPAPAPAQPRALALPARRPIVLDALHVEGKADAPRVLFVHAGPTVALEDAPAHPSYLRDDFTAALSSPVRVRVRAGDPARPTTAGGNR